MINFERKGKAKEAMGIGLTGEALEISNIRGDLSLQWSKPTGAYQSREYKLKKRWFIPLQWVIVPLMNSEKASLWRLKLLFRAKTTENEFFEAPGLFLFPWLCMWIRNRKIKNKKRYAEVDLHDMSVKKYNDSNSNRSMLTFFLVTEDMEKLKKIKDSGKTLEKVIYREKIYNINPNAKTLK